MALKVVGAGLGRTGTNSLKLALEQLLGAPCYHMFEVIANPHHVPHWERAVRGEPVEWDVLFEGSAATCPTRRSRTRTPARTSKAKSSARSPTASRRSRRPSVRRTPDAARGAGERAARARQPSRGGRDRVSAVSLYGRFFAAGYDK